MNEMKNILPRHLGVIMDGNGRWAQKRFLPRIAGHKQGAKVFKEISKYCADLGIKYLTVYAFSTENWNRGKEEIDGLMNIFKSYLRDYFASSSEHTGYKIKFIGDRSVFDQEIIDLMNKVEKESDKYDQANLNIALNYGSRQEILKAVKDILKKKEEGKIKISDVNIDLISNSMYTKNQPDPDLIIRTSGEQRISNFLLWQSAYTEYIFTDVLWPDFTKECIDKAIIEFGNRQRRYGGL